MHGSRQAASVVPPATFEPDGIKVRVFLRRAACALWFAALIRCAWLLAFSWKFSLARTPAHVPAVIEGEGFEGAGAWGEIEVPMSLECAGHGQRQYTNFIYPFKCDPPNVADGVCVPTPVFWNFWPELSTLDHEPHTLNSKTLTPLPYP